MCGIVGFIKTADKDLGSKTDAALRDALYFQRLRGVDALGIFKKTKFDKYDIIKDIGDPLLLMNKETKFKTFLNWTGDNKIVVAHNRHATRGDKKDAALAHPFMEEKKNGEVVVLVHNGTISHFSKDIKRAKSDSAQLAMMLAQGMSMSDIESEIWGSYALVWYDTEDDTLNFARNKERPFGFIYSDESIWFGSELYAIGGAIDRQGIKLDKFERLPAQQHWKYHLKDKKFEVIPVKEREVGSYSGKGNNVLVDEQDIWEQYSCLHGESLDRPDPPSTVLSKSTGATSSSTGATSVVPFPSPPPRYQSRSGASNKPRWAVTEEAMGYNIGAMVIFSLADYRATGRANQVVLEGNLLTFDGAVGSRLHKSVEVIGMVGLDIAHVDSSIHTWCGTLSQIYQGKSKGHENRYQFHVSDIKELINESPDKFREIQRSSAYEIAPNPLKPSVELPLPPLPQVPSTATGGTGGKGSTQSGNSFQCADCSSWFIPSQLHRLRKKDDDQVNALSLCGSCMRGCIKDVEHMEKLFSSYKAKTYQPEAAEAFLERILH